MTDTVEALQSVIDTPMKHMTLGIFVSREDAERAIESLHGEHGISTDEISYIYRNTEGEVTEVPAGEVTSSTVGEGAATGAWVGGSIGAIAGIATVAGVIPVVGPIFAAGPLVTALGFGAGALGTVTAGTVTGAAAGTLVGALAGLGVREPDAERYADRVNAGDVLVAVDTDASVDTAAVLVAAGATEVNVYEPVI